MNRKRILAFMMKEKTKTTLKDKIQQSIDYYEERLNEEIEHQNLLKSEISRSEGRMEILRDIIDDLKHDLIAAGEGE